MRKYTYVTLNPSHALIYVLFLLILNAASTGINKVYAGIAYSSTSSSSGENILAATVRSSASTIITSLTLRAE
jgi:hypothetical protein